MNKDFGKLLLLAAEKAKDSVPCMFVRVDEFGVDIILDTSITFNGEWIPGEGGDICLYRDRTNNNVVGAYLPLLQNRITVWTDMPLKINEGWSNEDCQPHKQTIEPE